MHLMVFPELFGPYLLHHRQALSETSEIFLAQTTGDFPRLCAIKRIRPLLARYPQFLEAFQQDASFIIRLVHGNLVQVLDVGVADDQPFMAMEHIDGVNQGDLVESARSNGPLPTEFVLATVIGLCEAISYVNARRQVSTTNHHSMGSGGWSLDYMVSFDGVPKLIDIGSFASARLELEGERSVYSPGFLTPELLRQGQIGAQSDVFAVALITWELLAGESFLTDGFASYRQQVVADAWKATTIDRRDVPGDVIRLVDQSLSLDDTKRPASIDDFRGRLVASLRRIAPAYGSAGCAKIMRRRFAIRAQEAEEFAMKLVRRARTQRVETPFGRTLSFSQAHSRKRVARSPIKLNVGDSIPGTRYRLIRQLGSGGSAEVFAAQHIDLDRQVAIKILTAELAQHADAIAQFRLEARTCNRIGHPNIVDVVDFGELADGRFFFAMELLVGHTLAELIIRQGALDVARAVAIFRQVTKALHAAHSQCVIHRDLKPENIMLVERDGRTDFVKVLDFGVMAFAAQSAPERVGTPGYMAPEQASGGSLPTVQMDIYAVGMSLYETLSGELPYEGRSLDSYARQQHQAPPLALRRQLRADNVPPPIERVVHRAIARDPRSRHLTMADLEADLIVAQKEAYIRTSWDDLTPPAPEDLRDERLPDLSIDQAEPSMFPGPRWVHLTSVFVAIVACIFLWLGIKKNMIATSSQQVANETRMQRRTESDQMQKPPSSPKPAEHVGFMGKTPSDGSQAEALRVQSVDAGRFESQRARATSEEKKAGGKRRLLAKKAVQLVKRGRALLKKGQIPAAKRMFIGALQANPHNINSIVGLATAAYAEGAYPKSVRYAKKAISINAKALEAHMLVGDSYYAMLRLSDAKTAWERVLRLDANNGRAKRRLAKLSADQSSQLDDE